MSPIVFVQVMPILYICKDQFEYLSEDQFEQVDKENTIYLEIDFHFNMCSFRDLQFQ